MEAKRSIFIAGLAVVLLCHFSSFVKAEKPIRKAARSEPAEVPNDWKRVDVDGKFILHLPPDMIDMKSSGIDSLFRQYRSETISLNCDYGLYSDRLEYKDKPNFAKEKVSVDDRSAYIVTYRQADLVLPLIAAIHFPDPTGDKETSLTVEAKCSDAKSQATAMQILKAITFP